MAVAYHVEVQPAALHDLEHIVDYISGELKNLAAAYRFAERATSAMQSLSTLPTRCSLYVPPKPLRREYRKLAVDNYLIFFWVSEEQEIVTVARVLYAGRDLSWHLQ